MSVVSLHQFRVTDSLYVQSRCHTQHNYVAVHVYLLVVFITRRSKQQRPERGYKVWVRCARLSRSIEVRWSQNWQLESTLLFTALFEHGWTGGLAPLAGVRRDGIPPPHHKTNIPTTTPRLCTRRKYRITLVITFPSGIIPYSWRRKKIITLRRNKNTVCGVKSIANAKHISNKSNQIRFR